MTETSVTPMSRTMSNTTQRRYRIIDLGPRVEGYRYRIQKRWWRFWYDIESHPTLISATTNYSEFADEDGQPIYPKVIK